MGPPGVSCRAVLAGAAAQRASVLTAGPLGLCHLPTFLCLGIVPVVAGLGGKAMVGNMIRVLRARMTLLAVDEAGMSTVEYSADTFYNPLILTGV